jgi:ureidoglycolate hydrolase
MYIVNTEHKVIKRISDSAFIPMDEANTDYQAYLVWVAEGNEAEEVEQ